VLAIPSVKLKKNLSTHTNICSDLKFNPSNESELFSCSFDCSVVKWDMRLVKKSSAESKANFLCKIEIGETLSEINSTKLAPNRQTNYSVEDLLISTMTPCFVHSNLDILCF